MTRYQRYIDQRRTQGMGAGDAQPLSNLVTFNIFPYVCISVLVNIFVVCTPLQCPAPHPSLKKTLDPPLQMTNGSNSKTVLDFNKFIVMNI